MIKRIIEGSAGYCSLEEATEIYRKHKFAVVVNDGRNVTFESEENR